jgi:amino acid transporter
MEQTLGESASGIRSHLSLWDAVSIFVGIVIGATIYETPPLVFQNAGSGWMGLGIWAIAGFLCLAGALCYAELATSYPRLGGDYVYLTRAYGQGAGFLYGWAQLTVIQTSSIGMMAYVFADYATQLWSLPNQMSVLFALLAVAILSLINILGLVIGKGTQNVLTAIKVLGLGGIVAAGLFYGHANSPFDGKNLSEDRSLGQAFVFVFLAYGGWNDAAFVAAEMRDKRRNIPLALVLGTIGVMVIYLLVNAAYLLSLGFEGAQSSKAIAADVLKLAFGERGSQVMCLLVMISALGAVNGLTFTSSRIYAALGADHRVFGRLSRWHPKWGTPIWSLLTQATMALTLIAAVGTSVGRQILNSAFQAMGFQSISWAGRGGFETLLQCSAPVFWLFFLLSGLSLFVLRLKDRDKERPFSVPLFPFVPLIFVATCGYMLYSGIKFADKLGLVGGGLLLAGIPLWLISRTRRNIHALQPIPAAGLVGASSLDLPDSRIRPDSEQPSPGPGGESQDAG